MPLLPLEPFLYPDGLFAEPVLPPDQGRWWVLHTRPRAEKVLARRCLDRGLPFFLPLHRRAFRCGGRFRESFLPLFPGYLFLLGSDEARHAALTTNQVARVLPVDDQARLHADLSRIHQLLDSGAAVTPEERLLPGAPVEIINGPLAGLRGKVIRRGRHHVVFVAVNFLQRGASVEVEDWMLQPIAEDC